jgi:hypothetical protein
MSNTLGKYFIQEYGLTELEATPAKFSEWHKQFQQIIVFLEVVEEPAQLPNGDLMVLHLYNNSLSRRRT